MPGNNYPRNFKTVHGYDAGDRLVEVERHWRHDNGKITIGPKNIFWPGVEPVRFETVVYPDVATKGTIT